MARNFIILLMLTLCPLIARAEGEVSARFDIRLGPLRVAELRFEGRETASAYAIAVRVTSAGLAGAFRTVRFDMQAQGARAGNRLAPQSYGEDVNTGRRQSTVSLRYRGGVPQVTSITPAPAGEPWNIAPADQAGTLDPATALHQLGRRREETALCDWQAAVFDGRRRSLLRLGPAMRAGDEISCQGLYRRVAGFAPEDIAERRDFPFTAHFAPLPSGLWRLTRVETETLYGRVRLTLTD